jgi:hypothetical protein
MAKTEIIDQPIPAVEPPESKPKPKKSTKKQDQNAAGQFETLPKLKTFWERVREIRAEDWGPRYTVYLYRIEPVIDRLVSANQKYLRIYSEAITEEQIMAEFGSGKYRAMLVCKKPGTEQGQTSDTFVFEILNLKYPPCIPKGEWVDDPRNKRWAWAKEPEPQLKPGLAEVADAFNTFTDMQDRIREQVAPKTEGTGPTSQLKDLVEATKSMAEMMKPAENPANPVKDAFSIAESMLKLQTSNPMSDFVAKRLESMERALEESRKREFELQEKFLKQFEGKKKEDDDEEGPKGIIGQIEQLKKLKDILMDDMPRRGGSRNTFLDIAERVLPQLTPLLAPWSAAIAARMTQGPQMPGMTMPAVAPAAPPPAGQAPKPQGDTQGFLEFVNQITPTMIAKLRNGESGGNFASWLYEGWPDTVSRLQTLSHPSMPGVSGAQVIIQFYRSTPYWPTIALHESQFVKFVEEFCKWKPEDDEIQEGDAEPSEETGDEEPERID